MRACSVSVDGHSVHFANLLRVPLQSLRVWQCRLATMPPFPPNSLLRDIWLCETEPKTLPSGLESLRHLRELEVKADNLCGPIPTLPDSLVSLKVDANGVTALPSPLPRHLRELHISSDEVFHGCLCCFGWDVLRAFDLAGDRANTHLRAPPRPLTSSSPLCRSFRPASAFCASVRRRYTHERCLLPIVFLVFVAEY